MQQPLPVDNHGKPAYPLVRLFLSAEDYLYHAGLSGAYSSDWWPNITTRFRTNMGIPGRIDRLENIDCINAYAEVLNPTRRNLVIVTANASTEANNSILALAEYRWSLYAAPQQRWFSPYLW